MSLAGYLSGLSETLPLILYLFRYTVLFQKLNISLIARVLISTKVTCNKFIEMRRTVE
jgi:hypothetical protein